ncbi:hypothetical protein JY419_00725 [Stenotrophomonas maltophilia]|nr:hypothetical protein [Stenotrophomonas maltophilia]
MPADPQRQFDMCLIIFYLLDWGLLAQIWSGMSPCMTPGLGDCVVWWDAWAALAASVGVITTLALGAATVYLAVSANRTSHSAMGVALRGVENQEKATRAERTLILIRVQAEVASVATVCDEIGKRLTQAAFEELVSSEQARWVLHELVKMLRLPVTDSLTPRLYNLAGKESAYLARSLGACETLRESWSGVETTEDREQLKMLWDSLLKYRLILSHDLFEIKKAAASAVAASGITSRALARELGIDYDAIRSSAALD